MTVALKSVFTRLSKMTPDVQNSIAELIWDELLWDEAFAKTQKQLSTLADEALEEHKKGLTRPLKFT